MEHVQTSQQATAPPRVPKWFGDWFRYRFPKGEDPFRPPEVWQQIDCSKSAVYRAIRNGDLRAIRVGGRYVIPRPGLRTWLKENYFTRE